jgi:hypothetical protein
LEGFLKQLIVNAFVSLVSGIFLVVGVAGTAWVVEKAFREESKRPHRPMSFSKPLPDGAVVETSVVPNVPNFAVRGSVRNTDTKDWDVTEIRVDLLSKGVVVNKCSDVVDYRTVKPGQTVNFLVVCRDIASPVSGEPFEHRVIALQFHRDPE